MATLVLASELHHTYPVSLFPDHRGPEFQHVNSRIQRLDFHGTDHALLHPNLVYYALCPGTLVQVLFTEVGSQWERYKETCESHSLYRPCVV